MRTIVLGFASILWSAGAAWSAPVDLAPKLRAGDVATYDTATAQKQSYLFEGQPEKVMTSTTDIRLRLEVVESGADGARVSMRFERVRVAVAGPAATLDFDSDWDRARDAENMFAPAIRAIVGKEVSATIGVDGAARRFEGIDAVAAGAADERSSNVVKELLKEAGLRETLESIYRAKPAPTSVEVGASWTEESSIPNALGSISLSETRTLSEVTGDGAAIGVTGEGALRKTVEPTPGGAAVEVRSVSITGEARWSLARGRLEKLDHALTIVATDDDPNRGGGRLTQTVVNTTRIEEVR